MKINNRAKQDDNLAFCPVFLHIGFMFVNWKETMHPKFDAVTVNYALAELHMGIKIHIIKKFIIFIPSIIDNSRISTFADWNISPDAS